MIAGMERLVITVGTAASMIAVAGVVVAQGILDPAAETWERYVGGSILVVAAVLIVRWSFRMIRTIQEVNSEERGQWGKDREAMVVQLEALTTMIAGERLAWADERKAILDQLDKARSHVAELSASLTRERDLRATLEKAGIADRREIPPIESGSNDAHH